MLKLIKNGHVVTDEWKILTVSEGETPHSVKLPAGPVLVPVSVWRARRSELIHSEYEHGWPLGIWLAADEGPEAIERDIEDFSVIAIEFNQYTDGKGYSAARLLREQYGYRGELRAIGDVPRDRHYLQLFGFDAIESGTDKNTGTARAGYCNFNLLSSPHPNLQIALAAG
jgi:uncharacterized protein (DUF934 family)